MDFFGTHKFSRNRYQQGLLVIYAVVWIWAAASPVDRGDWLLENFLVVAAAGFLYWIYRKQPLSNVSATLVVVFMIFHAIGSHYTYSLVPAGEWLRSAVVAFMVIATWSGFYELLEWLTAVIVEPSAGNAFLGTQGDEFDSQKDHALVLFGSSLALVVAATVRK